MSRCRAARQTSAATGNSVGFEEVALERALIHLVGQSRAFLHQVDAALHEIDSMHDQRAFRVVEALQMTTAEPARPGTLRHLERAASELLVRLCETQAT